MKIVLSLLVWTLKKAFILYVSLENYSYSWSISWLQFQNTCKILFHTHKSYQIIKSCIGIDTFTLKLNLFWNQYQTRSWLVFPPHLNLKDYIFSHGTYLPSNCFKIHVLLKILNLGNYFTSLKHNLNLKIPGKCSELLIQ